MKKTSAAVQLTTVYIIKGGGGCVNAAGMARKEPKRTGRTGRIGRTVPNGTKWYTGSRTAPKRTGRTVPSGTPEAGRPKKNRRYRARVIHFC